MLELLTERSASFGQGLDVLSPTWGVEDIDQLPDDDEFGIFNVFDDGSDSDELPGLLDEELIDMLAGEDFKPPLELSDSEPELSQDGESPSVDTAGLSEVTETPTPVISAEKEGRLIRWLSDQTYLAANVAASTTLDRAAASGTNNPTTLTRHDEQRSAAIISAPLPLKPVAGAINKRARKSANDDPRPFHCTFSGCGHKATKRRYLLEHERVHSGERPYKCTWPGCSYAASGQGHISRHIRTHTGDRPYPCKEPGCGYFASQSGHLRTHMRTHTGERPYKCPCDGCDYAAGRPGHLARHMKVHAVQPDLCKAAAAVR